MNKPIVQNAADDEQLREAKSRLGSLQTQEAKDIVYLGKLPEFRRFMYQFVNHIDMISATDSGSWTYYNEGQRSIGLKIKAKICEVDPMIYFQIMKDGKEI